MDVLPAASEAVAAIVTVPSGTAVASMPSTVTWPAPFVAGALFVTETPFRESVTLTVSVESDVVGRVTVTETEARLAR
jgi:hypothetical protein